MQWILNCFQKLNSSSRDYRNLRYSFFSMALGCGWSYFRRQVMQLAWHVKLLAKNRISDLGTKFFTTRDIFIPILDKVMRSFFYLLFFWDKNERLDDFSLVRPKFLETERNLKFCLSIWNYFEFKPVCFDFKWIF